MPRWTNVDREVIPVCQAALRLTEWAEETMCNSASSANDRMIVKATPIFGPLKAALETEDATKIFRLATLISQDLKKRPEKFDKDHPITKLRLALEGALHPKEEKNESEAVANA